ncbi:MAG: transglycosylase domain-containing protein [Tidjanibacter sp.]|nr:transglycosylase domain-containing protein [Tidjanibacter sp.]
MKRYKDLTKSAKVTLWFWVAVLVPSLAVIGFITATACGSFGSLPSFEDLENPKSNLATDIISEDGVVLGSFYVQNRSYADYEELAPALVQALVATEDSRFYSHSGIDFISLARVGVKTLALGDRGQGGGSTITQQLAKNLFPRDTARTDSKLRKTGKLVIAKFKEWITAVKLEHNYTKDEIVSMYFNTVFYGSNAYGIKSAAHTFFKKLPSDLNIQEAALLVGVVNAPTKYSPVRNPQNALKRRNTVLGRMGEAGYLTSNEVDSLSALPIELNYSTSTHNDGLATYFREMIRLTMTSPKPTRNMFYNEYDYKYELERWESNPIYGWCLKNKKADGTNYDIYRDGLRIYTTLNATMQQYAEDALIKQMTTTQKTMDNQVKRTKVLFQKTSKKEVEKIINKAIRESDRYYEMSRWGHSAEEIMASFDEPVNMTIFTYKGEVDTLMTPRDSIWHHKRILRASLVAMDPHTGHIKAYVGGPSFRYFKYDMAKQGKRQVGSTIKPFIYTYAFDRLGYDPCTGVPNVPTSIVTPSGTVWTPKEAGKVEYDGEFYPLRWGLARSRNNYSAWIMEQSRNPDAVADFIHKMGVKSYIDPVYSLCLGSSDASLFEMAGAYSTFVNRGVFTEPIFVTRIEDRHGNIIAEFTPKSSVAISEVMAHTMVDMMRTVIQAGTGRRLIYEFGAGGMEVGGKTGTSQENRDAWFMCVAPNLVGGVWVGGENQSIHLSRAGEGSVVALPIYGEFLRSVLKDGSLGVTRKDRFHNPPGAKNYSCWEPESPYNDDAVYAEEGEEGGDIDWDAEYRSNMSDFDVDANIDVDTYKKQKKQEQKASEESTTSPDGSATPSSDKGSSEKPAKPTPPASVVYEEEEEFF